MNPRNDVTWQLERQGTIVATPQLCGARLTPDGERVVGGGFDGTIRWWDLSRPAEGEAAEPQKQPAEAAEGGTLAGHRGWVDALAVAQDLIISGDSWGRLAAWRRSDGADGGYQQLWQQPQAHDGWLRRAALSPDGQAVATCGRDGALRTWAVSDGRPLRQWRADEDLQSLAWLDDGRCCTGDARGRVRLWSSDSDLPVASFDASPLYKVDRLQDVGGVKALAVDSDAGLLLAGGAEPTRGATVQGTPAVLVYDLRTGKLARTVRLGAAKDCFVHDLALHPEGCWLAVTCGTPGTGQLVLFRPDEEAPLLRDTSLLNPHSVSLHAASNRAAVATTNRGSNGNGRRLDADGQYAANSTPIELLQLTRQG